MARVRAQLRRYQTYNPGSAPDSKDVILHGALELNVSIHECLVNGQVVSLTPMEFSILRILLERRGQAVSSEDLFHAIWKDEYYIKSNNTISVHIRHLREKSAIMPKIPSTSKPNGEWGIKLKSSNHDYRYFKIRMLLWGMGIGAISCGILIFFYTLLWKDQWANGWYRPVVELSQRETDEEKQEKRASSWLVTVSILGGVILAAVGTLVLIGKKNRRGGNYL